MLIVSHYVQKYDQKKKLFELMCSLLHLNKISTITKDQIANKIKSIKTRLWFVSLCQ
jgi:hypothetical protein